MRSLACALVVMLVACAKPSGIELVIEAGNVHEVATVRAFVGMSPIANVDSMTVPNAAGSATRTNSPSVFARDPDGVDSETMAFFDGVSFEFQPGDLDALPAVIVVGYSSSGAAIGAALVPSHPFNAHEVDQYTITLEAIGINNSPDELFLWSPDPTTPVVKAACAGLVTPAANAFIVIGGDTDCDGYGDTDKVECDPFYYMDPDGTAKVATSDDTCFVPVDGTAGEECQLGTDKCIDGSGPQSGMCAATGICMPTPDCACTPGAPLGCLVADPSKTPYFGYACQIGTKNAGNCTIHVDRPPTGGFGCVPVASPGNLTGISTDGSGTFAPQATLNGVVYNLTVTAACDVTLVPQASAMSGPDSAALLRIDLANGNSLILPMDLSFTGTDCAASTCPEQALDAPPLTECVAGWTVGAPINFGMGALSPTLRNDMLEMLFLGTDGSVHTATRVSAMAPFDGSSAVVTELAPTPLSAIRMSGDGKTLWGIDETGTVVEFTRMLITDAWTPTMFTEAPTTTIAAFSPDTAVTDAIVAITGAGMAEAKLDGGSGMFDTFVAFGTKTAETPSLSGDGLTLYYADDNGAGTNAIYVASRPDQTTPFTLAVEAPELGMSNTPQSPWVAPDGRTMFYTSDNGGPVGSAVIYTATR